MMPLLKIIISAGIIFLLGWPLVDWLIKQRFKPLAKMALAWLTGSGLLAWQLFLFLAIGKLTLGNWFWYLITVEAGVGLFWRRASVIAWWRAKKFNFKFTWQEWLLGALLTLIIAAACLSALVRPTITYDSVAIWSWRARALSVSNAFDFNPESFTYLGGIFHRNYPWQVPLLLSWFNYNLGASENAANIIFCFYFAAIIILLAAAIGKRAGRIVGLLAAIFFATMPLIFYHAATAYADLPLAAYLLAGIIFLVEWWREQRWQMLALAGVFFGLACLIKLEGALFLLAALAVILMGLIKEKIKLNKILFWLLPLIIIILPWSYFFIKYQFALTNIEWGLTWQPRVILSLAAALFWHNSWNVYWFVLVAVLFLSWSRLKKNRVLFYGWLWLGLAISGFLILYLFTGESRFVLNQTAASRNFLLLVPASLYLAVLSLRQYFYEKNNSGN